MRAVDTNVLVRLVVRDDDAQVEAAQAFVASGAWVSHVVLAETVWVLDSFYEFEKAKLVKVLDMLLTHELLVIQDGDVVRRAIDTFSVSAGVDFSDCLIREIAVKAGHTPLGTLDRRLGKLRDVVAL